MDATRARWSIALVLASLAVSACGGAARAGTDGPGRGTTDPSLAELEAIYRARADSARTRFTEADVRFMNHMIAHHAQAVAMASLADSRAASASVKTLAARIINAQQDEIATMQQWLRDRGQRVPEVHVEGTQVMVHGSDHGAHMPGMLTPEQLRQLEQARGVAFDRLFLEYMIQHHKGAVSMVHELFRTDGAGQDEAVFKFASDVQVDQATEVARMERMLEALPPAGRAP